MTLTSLGGGVSVRRGVPCPDSSRGTSLCGNETNDKSSNIAIIREPFQEFFTQRRSDATDSLLLRCAVAPLRENLFSNLQYQPVLCFNCFARPQRSCFGRKIDVVPLRIQMSQDQLLGLAVVGYAHRIRKLEVLLHRFVSSERTFHQQQRSTFGE